MTEEALVLTCMCGETCASVPGAARYASGKTLLDWVCAECGDEYRYEIREGESYADLEAASLRLAREGATAEAVAEYARRLKEADAEGRRWLRLSRLLRAWRKRAGLTQEGAAVRAGIAPRDYKRLEAGEPRLKLANVEKAVRGVAGGEEQMRLLVSPGSTGEDFGARLAKAERQLMGALPVLKPVDDALMPSRMSADAEKAVAALGRALVSNGMSEPFLFYAQFVHEVYWCRRLGGSVRLDDLMVSVIRLVKELIDRFKQCRGKRESEALLGVVRRELEVFLTRESLREASSRFLLLMHEEALADEQLRVKLGLKDFEPLDEYFTPAEGMLLALFDRAAPERRRALTGAMRQIEAWDKRKAEGKRG